MKSVTKRQKCILLWPRIDFPWFSKIPTSSFELTKHRNFGVLRHRCRPGSGAGPATAQRQEGTRAPRWAQDAGWPRAAAGTGGSVFSLGGLSQEYMEIHFLSSSSFSPCSFPPLICGDGSLSRRSPFWTQRAGTASVAAEGRRGSARKESDRDYFTSLIKSNYTSQILWPREVYHASISCLFYQPELQTVTT